MKYFKENFKEIIVILLILHMLLFGIFVFKSLHNDHYDKKGFYMGEHYDKESRMSDKDARYDEGECNDKKSRMMDKEKKCHRKGYCNMYENGEYHKEGYSDENRGTKTIADREEYKSDEARQSVAIVKRSIENFNQDPQKTLKDVSDGVYVEDEIYVSVIKDGNNVGHPFRKDLENNQISHLVDRLGNRYGEEISNTTEEGKWIEYIFTVPETNEEAFKSTYCERSNEHIFCAGFYYTN